jgi:hypothetical protein
MDVGRCCGDSQSFAKIEWRQREPRLRHNGATWVDLERAHAGRHLCVRKKTAAG